MELVHQPPEQVTPVLWLLTGLGYGMPPKPWSKTHWLSAHTPPCASFPFPFSLWLVAVHPSALHLALHLVPAAFAGPNLAVPSTPGDADHLLHLAALAGCSLPCQGLTMGFCLTTAITRPQVDQPWLWIPLCLCLSLLLHLQHLCLLLHTLLFSPFVCYEFLPHSALLSLLFSQRSASCTSCNQC